MVPLEKVEIKKSGKPDFLMQLAQGYGDWIGRRSWNL